MLVSVAESREGEVAADPGARKMPEAAARREPRPPMRQGTSAFRNSNYLARVRCECRKLPRFHAFLIGQRHLARKVRKIVTRSVSEGNRRNPLPRLRFGLQCGVN